MGIIDALISKRLSELEKRLDQKKENLVYSPKEVPPNREVLLKWTAPSRVFVQRTQQFYKHAATGLIIACFVLILAGQFLLVGVIVSIAVWYYASSTIPPDTIQHEIDNYGILYFGNEYYWNKLKYYFFTEESGIKVLNVDTTEVFPGRLYLLLENVTEEQVREILGRYIPFREMPPQTIFDKAFKAILGKLSFE